MKKLFSLLVIVAVGYAYWFSNCPIQYPAGVLIESDPAQITLPNNTPAFDHGKFRLKPLAIFTADVRVLHSKTYWFDAQSALVPIDLAVGWGPMSDQSVLDQMQVSQSMRFFWYQYRLPPPIPVDQIICHATNIHIIPANAAVASRCKSLRTGTLVHLSGELVEATGGEIGTWRSSLSRTDTGNGACELMYLESIEPLSVDTISHHTKFVGR